MDIQKETAKLDAIEASGKFTWKGTTFTLDRNSTSGHKDNGNLAGRPLRKLVGTDEKGNIVSVWSHDVEAVVIPVNEVEEDQDVPEEKKPAPVVSKKKKLAPAKKGKS